MIAARDDGPGAEAVAGPDAQGRANDASPKNTLLRQSIFYALLCAGTGASLPFLPFWLGQNGMSASQIGWILGIPLIGRAVTGPITGLWADRFTRYRSPLIWLALVAAIAYGLMGISSATERGSFFVYLMLYSVGYTGMASITPLLDSMTLQLSRIERFAFSWVRAAGSAAFIFANICLGFLLQTTGVDAAVIWTVASACTVCIGARYLLPKYNRVDPKLVRGGMVSGPRRLITLLASPHFLLLLAGVGCLQAAHSYYYAFSTIIWKDAGLSSATCGLLWATAVLGELLFLSFGGAVRRFLGPWNLLLVGAIAGVLRWSLLAYFTDLWILWPLQVLHSFSFIAVYLAGLELVFLLVPPGYEGLGQAINSAYASGVLTGVVTLFSGVIFERWGERGYAVMAALAALGLALVTILYLRRNKS
jgi:MFS transporter, PPP family, 3-phenylpropionic acid transporter